MPKRPRESEDPNEGHASRPEAPVEIGSAIRDVRERKTGVVMDYSCQYAHPKAPPVYNYLIRWEDGQIQAVSEYALSREFGLELVD